LDADLDLAFVLRLSRTGWDDRRTVVLGELLVSSLDHRLIGAWAADSTAKLVRDDDLDDTTDVFKGADMACDEVGRTLSLGGLGVDQTRCTQGGNEHLYFARFAGASLHDRGRHSGIVDEELLAGAVDLAHRELSLLGPAPVVLAELGISIPGRMIFQILDVE
jgi:hypothetical protein